MAVLYGNDTKGNINVWMYKGELNSASGENWKEPSSSTISTEALFNGDSNEDTLNITKTSLEGLHFSVVY